MSLRGFRAGKGSITGAGVSSMMIPPIIDSFCGCSPLTVSLYQPRISAVLYSDLVITQQVNIEKLLLRSQSSESVGNVRLEIFPCQTQLFNHSSLKFIHGLTKNYQISYNPDKRESFFSSFTIIFYQKHYQHC